MARSISRAFPEKALAFAWSFHFRVARKNSSTPSESLPTQGDDRHAERHQLGGADALTGG
jgi:hypothetical protein